MIILVLFLILHGIPDVLEVLSQPLLRENIPYVHWSFIFNNCRDIDQVVCLKDQSFDPCHILSHGWRVWQLTIFEIFGQLSAAVHRESARLPRTHRKVSKGQLNFAIQLMLRLIVLIMFGKGVSLALRFLIQRVQIVL